MVRFSDSTRGNTVLCFIIAAVLTALIPLFLFISSYQNESIPIRSDTPPRSSSPSPRPLEVLISSLRGVELGAEELDLVLEEVKKQRSYSHIRLREEKEKNNRIADQLLQQRHEQEESRREVDAKRKRSLKPIGGIPPKEGNLSQRYKEEEELMPLYCGRNWQTEYAKLHADILEGRSPPKYLVSVGVEAGLADRLSGIVSEFYFALLTGRALQITSHSDIPPFEAAFDSPFISWKPKTDYPPALYEPLKLWYNGVFDNHEESRRYPPEVNSSLYHPEYLVNSDNQANWLFFQEDLQNYHHEQAYHFWASNRGRATMLFENRFHRVQIQKLGIHAHYAFGCALRYLFRPNPLTMKLMEYALPALSEPETLKISINIRVGDQVWTEDKYKVKDYSHFFLCATEIEESRAVQDQKIIWYFMSDSLSLRKDAKKVFGDKVLTDTKTPSKGLNCAWLKKNEDDCNEKEKARRAPEVIRSAASQLWLSSMADYHIITENSGFGGAGAFLSMNFNHIYQMERNGSQIEYRIPCKPFFDTPVWAVASQWAGL